MPEGMVPPEIAEEAEKDETGKTGEGAEEAERKEAEPEQTLEARYPDGKPVEIYPEGTGIDNPVKLEFRKSAVPSRKELNLIMGLPLHLVKTREMTASGAAGFEKIFWITENREQEGIVIVKELLLPPDKLRETVNMT